MLNEEKMGFYGFEFEDINALIAYVKNEVDYLSTHNKNYTKTQYRVICSISEALECVDR